MGLSVVVRKLQGALLAGSSQEISQPKMFVSTVILPSHAFAYQFGLAIIYIRKCPKTRAKNELIASVTLKRRQPERRLQIVDRQRHFVKATIWTASIDSWSPAARRNGDNLNGDNCQQIEPKWRWKNKSKRRQWKFKPHGLNNLG